MSKDSKLNQVASATNKDSIAKEPSSDDVVFTNIYRKDRDYINNTKGELNRQERLHVILEHHKKLELAETYYTDGAHEKSLELLAELIRDLRGVAATPGIEGPGAGRT